MNYMKECHSEFTAISRSEPYTVIPFYLNCTVKSNE